MPLKGWGMGWIDDPEIHRRMVPGSAVWFKDRLRS